jgi:molybdenum cofactor cytidylyltransferase
LSHSSNIAVLIPAAGASQRMGSVKQLLEWGTSTLLGHSIETVRSLKCSEICVVLGANYDIIKSEIDSYPIKIVNNEEWESGLGRSIAFGVQHLIDSSFTIDGILIMLADQPLIDANYLNSMIEIFKPEEQQIIATYYDNHKQGVPALFDKTYFEELTKLSDDKGAKEIIEKYSNNVTMLTAHGRISDIDTQQDYEDLYKANHQL